MNQDISYYVALSILKHRYLKEVYKMLSDYSPAEILKKINPTGTDCVSQIYTDVYGVILSRAVDRIVKRSLSLSANIIAYSDNNYPALLRHIDDPPPVLYSTRDLPDSEYIAVVGSRKPFMLHKDITFRISSELAYNGYTIVSGMAEGIDRSAHLGAIKCGGSTVGVLANGINKIYPHRNSDLFNYINESEKSALISEYAPDITAGKWTFVKRNRIISGISRAVVIAQAPIKSGALMTAKYALQQSRDVLACPGHSYEEKYAGCMKLIQDGAYPVYETKDIVKYIYKYKTSDIPVTVPNKKRFDSDEQFQLFNNNEEQTIKRAVAILKRKYESESIKSSIVNCCLEGHSDIDEISRIIKKDVSIVNSKLVEMEIEGDIYLEGRTVKPAL